MEFPWHLKRYQLDPLYTRTGIFSVRDTDGTWPGFYRELIFQVFRI
jgi:hypothetical protein